MHIRLTVPRQPSQRHKLRRMKRTNTLQLLVATALSVAAGAQVQSSTDVPPGQHAILTVTGKGVQIYECQLVENIPQWVFQAPDASLYNASGAKVGVHGSGPSWRYFDGSSVRGEVVAKSAAPEPTSIPWLLLKTVDHDGSGIPLQHLLPLFPGKITRNDDPDFLHLCCASHRHPSILPLVANLHTPFCFSKLA